MFLKGLVAFLASIYLSGCLQTENSSSTDGFAPEGSLYFAAASEVFKTRCIGCHHDYHTLPESDFFEFGLAIFGNAEGSPIYYRLMGSTGPGGPKTMPGTALSPSEIVAIRAWIDVTPPP